jgi:hypothetical protein
VKAFSNYKKLDLYLDQVDINSIYSLLWKCNSLMTRKSTASWLLLSQVVQCSCLVEGWNFFLPNQCSKIFISIHYLYLFICSYFVCSSTLENWIEKVANNHFPWSRPDLIAL